MEKNRRGIKKRLRIKSVLVFMISIYELIKDKLFNGRKRI